MFKTAYLVAYNLACAYGWALVWKVCFEHIKEGPKLDTFYSEIETNLQYAQTAAVMEILHAIFRLVKSNPATTFLQVFSRIWVLWMVMHVAPDAQTSTFTLLCVTSWATVEIPRYIYYALNLLNAVPYPLKWLRYSLFAILYPTGISGELGCMYNALLYFYNLTTPKTVFEIPVQPGMPGIPINSNLVIILYIIVAITYIPGSPKMYKHMLKERNKQLNGIAEDKKKKQ